MKQNDFLALMVLIFGWFGAALAGTFGYNTTITVEKPIVEPENIEE